MGTFSKTYTAKELNEGMDMKVHPITGRVLTSLLYWESKAQFYWYRARPQMGWSEIEYDRILQGRIGTGKARYEIGYPYPAHWRFDPFTGEKLEKDQ